jgi:hypothetical protein
VSRNVSITVHATVTDRGVSCQIACDGQEATVIFDGAEVFVEVPEPAKAAG